MHLADTFIQSYLYCIQSTQLISSCFPFGIKPMTMHCNHMLLSKAIKTVGSPVHHTLPLWKIQVICVMQT